MMEKKMVDPCKCERCPECEGSGNVWYSFGGQYLGNRRCDDMDNLETCDNCRGSGIVAHCDNCISQYEDENDE